VIFWTEIDDSSCLYVVDCDSIVLTEFHLLFLVYLLASYYAKSGSREASCAQAVEDLQTSNYFVSLPPHADWKLIGWDRKLSSEEKNQEQRNSK
jgi:hypothetical protein